MPSLTQEHTFTGEINGVFTAISTYSKYPEYLPGVQKIEVLPAKSSKSTCQVRYELNLIKTFYYILNMYAEKPGKIWWDLEESNLMTANEGSWDLKPEGKTKVHATYTLDIGFKGLVPRAITDRLAKANLPLMFSGFQKMIDDLGSK